MAQLAATDVADAAVTRFAVLVPLKSTRRGKSRLALPADRRSAMAAAMALDTVDAVRRCTLVAGVLVLIEEPSDARLFDDGDFDDAATPASIRVHQCHTDGIDAALTEGARLLAADGWREKSTTTHASAHPRKNAAATARSQAGPSVRSTPDWKTCRNWLI